MEFIAFDFETTGLFAGVDQIVEIGAVKFVNGAPESCFVTLVNPGIRIPVEASRVSGITDDMVASAPPIESLLDGLAEFCGETLMVAHNANFDYGFLKAVVERYESRAPGGLILDTIPLAKKVFPGLLNYKLGTLTHHLGIQATEFHRAQADAISCGHLMTKVLEKLTTPNSFPDVELLCKVAGNNGLRLPQIIKQPKQMDLFSL